MPTFYEVMRGGLLSFSLTTAPFGFQLIYLLKKLNTGNYFQNIRLLVCNKLESSENMQKKGARTGIFSFDLHPSPLIH